MQCSAFESLLIMGVKNVMGFQTSNPVFKECIFYQLQHSLSSYDFLFEFIFAFKHISALGFNIPSFTICR